MRELWPSKVWRCERGQRTVVWRFFVLMETVRVLEKCGNYGLDRCHGAAGCAHRVNVLQQARVHNFQDKH